MDNKVFTFFKKIWTWWKSQRKRIKFAIIFGVFVLFLVLKKVFGPEEGVVVEKVVKGDLTKTVIASGTVVSTTDLSLGFEVSDAVKDIKVFVGQKVKKGDVLVVLKNAEEQASYTSARGALLAAQARYKKVLDGSSNEEIALAQVNLDNAEKDLATTKKTQDVLVENARRKLLSDGLVAESVNSTPFSNTPTVSGTYTGNEGEYGIAILSPGSDFINISGIETGVAKYSTTAPQQIGTRGLSVIFPSGSSSASSGSWKIKIPNTSGPSYVVNLNAYNQAKENRDAAVSSAESLVATRTAELNLKRATARPAEVDAALADVITAQAGLEQASARIEKKILRAPADGTITRIDVKIGEVVTPQKEVVVLQDVGNLYLEASVGEGNIGSIVQGQQVVVSYDAFPEQKSSAVVSSIDPAATKEGSIINYKIKALIETPEQIRPGMTANMAIITAQNYGVLTIPARVVTKNEIGNDVVEKITRVRGKRYKTDTVVVTLGIKGDGDMVEVKGGLSEGDQLLWRAVKK